MCILFKRSDNTSATIANVESQPLVETVDVVEVEVAILAVPEVEDAEEDVIKEVVNQDNKVSIWISTA